MLPNWPLLIQSLSNHSASNQSSVTQQSISHQSYQMVDATELATAHSITQHHLCPVRALRCCGLLSTTFQQTLRSGRPVLGSIRLASPFLAPLALFYMFGISLAGSTSGCSAVSVCLARLSDVFLVPAMTRATLYALGTGNRDASAITSQNRVACATTTTRHHHNPHRSPSHPAADRA